MPDLFLVILNEKSEETEKKIKTFYPRSYHQFSDTVFLISADTLTRSIAVNTGVRDKDSGSNGVVFKLEGSYSGLADPSLWEWLRKQADNGAI